MSHFCKHYPRGGMGDNTHCTQGIEMQSLRDESIVPHRLPCFTVGAESLCPKYEGYTSAEIAGEEQRVEDFFKKMVALSSRTSGECAHCGAHVERMVQVGKCVYSRPCGCRQFQGRVPADWKE